MTASLREQLAPLGTITFDASGTVDGAPVLVAMNDTVVAVAQPGAEPATAIFTDATTRLEPGATRVQLRIGVREFTIEFGDEAVAARLARVLRVRQDQVHRESGGPQYETRFVSAAALGSPRPAPRSEYEVSAQQTLLVGTLLIAVAGIDLLLGVVIALVLALSSNPLAAVVWLVGSVTGFLVPLGLGLLARTVVLRHRLLDGRAAG